MILVNPNPEDRVPSMTIRSRGFNHVKVPKSCSQSAALFRLGPQTDCPCRTSTERLRSSAPCGSCRPLSAICRARIDRGDPSGKQVPGSQSGNSGSTGHRLGIVLVGCCRGQRGGSSHTSSKHHAIRFLNGELRAATMLSLCPQRGHSYVRFSHPGWAGSMRISHEGTLHS